MPVITPAPFDPLCISMSVERHAQRNPGIHLSSVIKDRLITAGIERKVKGGKPFTKEEQHLLFERGFLWERMVVEFVETDEWIRHQTEESAAKHFAEGMLECHSNVLTRPGECVLDGIYMTPDAVNMSEYAVEEYKATGLRAKGFDIEARRPEWVWQACSYAKVFGMTQSLFRIWHVSDNSISSLRIVWTQQEVDENWARMVEHYQFMLERDTWRVRP